MSFDLTQNYFALFGLPVAYAIDRSALDQRYRELQRLAHPDRYASASDQERRIAMQQATRINEGYRVLKDRLARGTYLLELRGYHADNERSTHQDSAFLMEQMEMREELAAARTAADPLAALTPIVRRIEDHMDALEVRLAAALTQDQGVSAAAVTALQQMQFFRKLAQEAEALEADLEDAHRA